MTALGHGIGLRTMHYAELLERGSPVPCVEAITENFLDRGGRPAALLERVRRDADVVLHGVSLSIGGTDPLPIDRLARIRELAERIDAKVVSDHLCFGTFGGHHGHDLWPLPYTEEALEHVVARVVRAQDVLGRRLALENPSSYLAWASSTIPEAEFLGEIARRADCEVLLDVNNVHVSAHNHGFSALSYLDAIPVRSVSQIHVAGHSFRGGYLFDDHGSRVAPPVWALYRAAVQRFGDVTCIVEWDENVPSLAELVGEAQRARGHAESVRASLTAAVA